MIKKITALCVLFSINSIMNANGYPAEQGYQVPQEHHHGRHDHHHHNKTDKIADEADQHRLKILQEQDDAANTYTNISRTGLAIGAVVIASGLLAPKYKSNLVLAGTSVFALSATGGYLVHQAGKERAKERKDILERRAKNKHHH